jgi:ArsR family transcriptional regulator, arsenate/arsenite/antimonite-responsive transcriptional repressor / arsenate reductase (thioredoxin)
MYYPGVAIPATTGTQPPRFLELVALPLRWRLLVELARSDRRVHELCELLERSQPLVSYHLRRLEAEQLVERRRSAFDGRESYYVLDLGRCGELLAASGGALHPGLKLSPRSPAADRRAARRPQVRVLFLCTGNSARSQIAEALVGQLAGGAVEAVSAGSHPKPLHANTLRVLREHGIDPSGRRSRHFSEFAGQRFDYVISLCDRVHEVCPDFPGQPTLVHWSIADPAREGGSDEESYPAFERTADEFASRIPFLLDLIDHDLSTQEVKNA